jgi:hypothetical protein
MAQLGFGNGDLAKKHGKILISVLRKTYGTGFALGMPDNLKLIDVIHQLDERSLSRLARDSGASAIIQPNGNEQHDTRRI